jgi:hypothetical protein
MSERHPHSGGVSADELVKKWLDSEGFSIVTLLSTGGGQAICVFDYTDENLGAPSRFVLTIIGLDATMSGTQHRGSEAPVL